MEKPEVARIESNTSDVARLRNQIILEYQAAMRALHDPAIKAPHLFITLAFRLNSCEARREAVSYDSWQNGFSALPRPLHAKLV